MILHRLKLNNFRGVQDREICFPAHGVVVVCGPNEIGKSSMLEALDLLLTYRDRSTHRDVKQVKPANADVGAQVEAEISTGTYRFVYRKRFHKRHLTELDIIEPKREQLTGDEAHERVEAMLSETVDTKLWDAQRVLQSASTSAVNLSGSDALARALDAAAGAAAPTSAGVDTLLIDRIDSEFERYFTKAAGKPTKEWKAAIDRVSAAEAEVSRCREAVAEVDDRVSRHEQLTVALQELTAALEPAQGRLAAARSAHIVLADQADQLDQARLVAKAAAAASLSSGMNNGQRRELIAEVARRGTTLVAVQDDLGAAEREESDAVAAAEAATRAAERAAVTATEAQDRFDLTKAAAEACVAREEARADADRLAARLQRIERAAQDLAQVTKQLSGIRLTDTLLADIVKNTRVVERLQDQLHADAGTVAFTAPADLQITVDGEPRTLAAGEQLTRPASIALAVEVPGLLSVRIDPGASAAKLQADLLSAQAILDEALTRAGVADLAAARECDAQRRDLAARSTRLTATLEAQCDGDDVLTLRNRFEELLAAAADNGDLDVEAAAAELAAADADLRTLRAAADSRQKAAAVATAALNQKITRTTLLRDRLRTASAEFVAKREELSTLRAAVSDDDVAAQAAADADEQRRADEAVAALAERYAAADPAMVQAELVSATQAVDAMTADCEATTLALRDLAVELSVMGNEGRQGQLDEAEAELERARAAFSRIQDRASAVQLLRDTMIRHRDNTRQRYVAPYRAELERLGREVFGASFEVDVDTELTIQTRTLDGCTVPYASLSGGAKEQLGILARLAGAALVAKEDTVPVIIDDALGFTDPDRLVKMGAVLGSVGDRGQVIVLTCMPARYEGVADAEVIELSA